MNKEEAQKEIRRLSGLLSLYQDAYYLKNDPVVSDLEYDRLFDALAELEQKFPDLALPDSPVKRIGSDLSSEFPEVRHTIPVLSLDKGYSAESIHQWMEKTASKAGDRLSFVAEEKIDGVSIVLYYRDGILEQAVTRGNGIVGNDVTANVRTVRSVPLKLTESVDITVRGEIFLPVAEFESLNSQLEVPFANPRNLAAGTLRRKKSSVVASVPLDIFVYEGFPAEPGIDHTDILVYLQKLGFKVNRRTGVFSDNTGVFKNLPETWFTGAFSSLEGYINRVTSERKSLPYEIDGLVIKVNETDVRERLGFTGHHPRWAIAYKFESPEGETIIKSIDIQVGRTGRITPVARVEPVLIGGSTVSNVTLHNQEYINILELGIGDTVAVSKRGDVIPAVERVLDKNEEGNPVWTIPEECPSCGSALSVKGAHHFCLNNDCPDQVRGRIFFFLGRDQMDIEGFGPETAAFLIDNGFIGNIADLYTFDYDKLENYPGFGPKKITLLKEGIRKSLGQPYSRVLPSLGIPEVGKKAAELLIEGGLRSVDDLVETAAAGNTERLTGIKGIGERTAETIINEFSSTRILSLVDSLKKAGLNFIEEIPVEDETSPQVFENQVWCITGSFEHFKPRSLAADEIKKRGGRTVSSVTGNTTHLLAGESAGSKLDKARNQGARIITEEEFLGLIR